MMSDALARWAELYVIWHDPAGNWRAVPRTGPVEEPLTAATPGGLAALIRADHERRQR